MTHSPSHLVVGVIALAVALAIQSFTVNRLVKRKLRLSVFFLIAYVILHAVLAVRPGLDEQAAGILSLERLVLAAALINLVIVALLNPLRSDHVPDRFPAILQDAIVIGALLLISTFAFGDEFLTTSAVSAVVVGFALQDTLGNAFAGLAIQSEKPFSIGHWIAVGEHEGRVAEVTWRATKLRTKTGNFVIVPNNIVGKEPIVNYSEPAAPTRIQVEVGVSYDTPPNRVKGVLREALANCTLVLKAPEPDIIFANFGDSSLDFHVRFWIDDFARDEVARDQVRTAIYYAFRRRGIEIPYPIQTEIQKDWQPPDEGARIAEREQLIAGVDLLASLTDEHRRMIASATSTVVYADGETIVKRGQPGDSMYVLCSGEAAVMLEGRPEPIAIIEKGGYFGEMSLLTGDPRTASVVALGDVVALEIAADVFRQLADISPQTVEQVGIAAATRRAELEGARASAQTAAVVEAPANFLGRMRKFLRV